MTEVEEKYVSLSEIREALETESKTRELSYEKRLALEHAGAFATMSEAKVKKIVKELAKMERITPFHAYKIAEILPETPDEVRIIFQRDRFTLEKDEIDTILKVVIDNI